MIVLTVDPGIYLVGTITAVEDGWQFTCLSRHLSHQSAALAIRPDQFLLGPMEVATPMLNVTVAGDMLVLEDTAPGAPPRVVKRIPG